MICEMKWLLSSTHTHTLTHIESTHTQRTERHVGEDPAGGKRRPVGGGAAVAVDAGDGRHDAAFGAAKAIDAVAGVGAEAVVVGRGCPLGFV